MAAIRSTGTKPEERLGVLLKLAYPRRKLVRQPEGLEGKPDYLIPSLNLVLFADGCYWHGCPQHGRVPEDNRKYWEAKFDRNKRRDRQVTRRLRHEGYVVLRLWDHDLKGTAASAVRKLKRKVTQHGLPPIAIQTGDR